MRVVAGAIAFGVIFFLAFPHHVAGGALDLGRVLGWLPPAALVMVLATPGLRRPALLAGVAGYLGHALVFHWIFVALVSFGGVHPALGPIGPLALALYPAFFFALFGALWVRVRELGVVAPFAGAALWTALDHARTFVLTGFPWALQGYTQHGNPLLMPWVTITGVYGLSFLTVLGGIALARLMAGCRREAWPALVVVLLAHVVGAGFLQTRPALSGAQVRVGVVQGNILQSEKWALGPERTLEIYEGLTREAVAAGAQWVVWPETAAPGFPEWRPAEYGQSGNPLRARLVSLATETGVPLIIGALGGTPDAPRDSAYLVTPGSDELLRYDKSHLVPFGEYLPFRSLLGGGASAVATVAHADVIPGERPQALRIDDQILIGAPICYELLFPDLMRRFVNDGAQVLLALTNDAWYGRTGAPHQFLVITAMRSAETRRFTARAANTGISAVIDERGRVLAKTSIFRRGVLVEDITLGTGEKTWYTRHGDVFAWLCWLASAIAVAAASLAKRRCSVSQSQGDS